MPLLPDCEVVITIVGGGRKCDIPIALADGGDSGDCDRPSSLVGFCHLRLRFWSFAQVVRDQDVRIKSRYSVRISDCGTLNNPNFEPNPM